MHATFAASLMLVLPSLASGQATHAASGEHELTAGGWAFMALSLVFVWGLTFWCFKRVLSGSAEVDPGPAAKP